MNLSFVYQNLNIISFRLQNYEFNFKNQQNICLSYVLPSFCPLFKYKTEAFYPFFHGEYTIFCPFSQDLTLYYALSSKKTPKEVRISDFICTFAVLQQNFNKKRQQ